MKRPQTSSCSKTTKTSQELSQQIGIESKHKKSHKKKVALNLQDFIFHPKTLKSISHVQSLDFAISSILKVEIRSFGGARERISKCLFVQSFRLPPAEKSYRSRCLYPGWMWGRSPSSRSQCRWPHMRPNNPGRCAAVWTVIVRKSLKHWFKSLKNYKCEHKTCVHNIARLVLTSLPSHPSRVAPKMLEISHPWLSN